MCRELIRIHTISGTVKTFQSREKQLCSPLVFLLFRGIEVLTVINIVSVLREPKR